MATKPKDLQRLAAAKGATALEWSTISHTHGNAMEIQAADAVGLVKQLQQLVTTKGGVAPLEWSTISHTHT